ncbi:chorismate mutase [candidate division WOR-1 bacterium RIFCSPHIGHO2_01_FULL_53_15]|uniref:chorismate mutase n=1 Tax=candidate division WOR-1 bacterium RIFCSPHIGHO2_01_FULL_53_15 TaxID=1802564 RepID=A0A1F4Q3L2_UNCSA|nr:MAG: chorismate mutase [candidate division WOR-1 bacterium RIFCSPHIGHO2_01_FULL_53_15]OGC12461.1 MAG: chorismate mutase [candidate division WOR-1 bacterium RIFCSPHIGHO2_02_FULL_53_26]
MAIRGIRGATSVASNNKEGISAATKELLAALVRENELAIGDIASALFSSTAGLNAEFPAVAARELGWNDTPLLCMQEIDVPGSLKNCIRVLLHVNTDKSQKEMKHVYLREAVNLRR